MSAGSLYDLLGVDARATHDEIRRAYHRLAKRHHPDVGEDSEAAAHMVDLNLAWSVLGDPRARREYDRHVAGRTAALPAPPVQGTGTTRRLLRALIAVIIVLLVVLAFLSTVIGFAQSPTS